MQFDGNDLEKDNNNQENGSDQGTISWEDLLNGEDDLDLSALIQDEPNDDKKDVAKEPVNQSENVSSEQKDEADDELLEFINNNADSVKEVQEEKPLDNIEENNKDDVLNIDEAALNYVNSLERADTGVEAAGDTIKEENNESAVPIEDDVLYSLKEEGLLEDVPESLSSEKADEVVDDELLKLLNSDNDSASIYTNDIDTNIKAAETPAIENVETKNEEEATAEEVIKDDFSSSEEINLEDDVNEPEFTKTSDSAETAEIDKEENDIELEPVVVQAKKKTVSAPILIGAGALGLFVIIVVVLYLLFPGLSGANGDEELMTGDTSNYGIPSDNDPDAVEMQKQTDELMDKMDVAKNKKDEDKKVVVTVLPTGRNNPFVPSLAYDNGLSGIELSTPPDVDVNSPEAAAARKLMSIAVSGIMYDPNKPSAILKFDNTDYFVQKGDRIDSFTVAQITKDYVQIKNASNVYKAYVGEAFQAESAEIPASRQMKYSGGRRQYISAEDVQINTK